MKEVDAAYVPFYALVESYPNWMGDRINADDVPTEWWNSISDQQRVAYWVVWLQNVFGKLHKGRKQGIVNTIDTIRDQLKVTLVDIRTMTDAEMELRKTRCQNWHFIWCIFGAHTTAQSADLVFCSEWQYTRRLILGALEDQKKQSAENKARHK